MIAKTRQNRLVAAKKSRAADGRLPRLESLAHFVVEALGERAALGAKVAGQGVVTAREALSVALAA